MTIPQPGELIALSTFDSFYAPRLYMTTIIGYDTSTLGDAGSAIIVQVLRNLVVETIKRYPILGGSVQVDPTSHGMRMTASISSPVPMDDEQYPQHFTVVEQDDSMPSYAAWKDLSFSLGKVKAEKLCRYPVVVDCTSPEAVYAVQANIIKGGVVATFQLHHSVADGRTLSQIASYMTALLAQQDPGSPPALIYRLPQLENFNVKASPEELVSDCSERTISRKQTHGPETELEGEDAPELVQVLLLTASSKLEDLRDRCNEALSADESVDVKVSKNDVLGAFLWMCVTVARFNGQQGEGPTRLSSCYVPCDVRKRITPQISDEYFGTATLMARIQQPVEHLTAAQKSIEQDGDYLGLAKIALAIHDAIKSVDTAYVERRLQLALSVEAANNALIEQGGSVEELLQINGTFDKHTDVVLSTLAPIFDMGAGTLEMVRPQFFRTLHHAMLPGVVDVLPSIRQTGRIEMTTTLEEETVTELGAMRVWTDFVDEMVV